MTTTWAQRDQSRAALMLGAVLVVSFLAMGCAPKRVLQQRLSVPVAPGSAATVPAPVQPRAAPDLGHHVSSVAQTQLGRPYRWGGSQPHRGFDCSGLVQWSYGNVGVQMPRVVGDQQRQGRSIGAGELAPGDLVFFNLRGSQPSHVGIYIGDGRFVHAPRSGQPVRTDNLDDPYWRQRWSDSRRVLDH